MSKRLNHEGSFILLKDGRIRGKIMIDGHEYLRYGKTKGEAAEKINILKEKLKNNLVVKTVKITVGEWSLRWLEEYSRFQVKENTHAKNTFFINKRIIPYIGNIRLDRLTSRDVQEKLINGLLKDGLKRTSVRCIKNTLSSILKYAVTHRLILTNPCTEAKIKAAKHGEVKPLTEAQLNHFLSIAKERAHYLEILLISTTALRRSEACGLRWKDFNWDLNQVYVQRAVVRTHGNSLLVGDTKNDPSRRLVPIIDWVMDAFRKEHENVTDDNEFVFPGPNGFPVHPTLVYRTVARIGRHMGIEKMNVHRLRHTVASILLARGENPKIVQELLGHATLDQTMGTYSHLIPGLREQAIAKLSRVVTNPS